MSVRYRPLVPFCFPATNRNDSVLQLICDNLLMKKAYVEPPDFAEYRVEIEQLCRETKLNLLYLFGSQARREPLPMSDIDFAAEFGREVLESEFSERQEALIVELMKILGRDDVDVAILNRASPLLKHRAATEGRVLYQAESGSHASFLVRALREYDDTRSIREALRASLRPRHARR